MSLPSPQYGPTDGLPTPLLPELPHGSLVDLEAGGTQFPVPVGEEEGATTTHLLLEGQEEGKSARICLITRQSCLQLPTHSTCLPTHHHPSL